MADIVPVAQLSARANKVVEALRRNLARTGLGVTVQGTHVTIRWSDDGSRRLCSVTMVVDVVDDGYVGARDARVEGVLGVDEPPLTPGKALGDLANAVADLNQRIAVELGVTGVTSVTLSRQLADRVELPAQARIVTATGIVDLVRQAK